MKAFLPLPTLPELPCPSLADDKAEGGEFKGDSDSDSWSDSDSEYSDADSESEETSEDEMECDDGDPWMSVMRLKLTPPTTPDNTPTLASEAFPPTLDPVSMKLLSDKLSRSARRHLICWTCGVTIQHDPGCRRKHIPSKVRIRLQPAREIAFPKPLPTIRECEVELPETAPAQSSRLGASMTSQSASLRMLARIAAADTQARQSQTSRAKVAMQMLSTPVSCVAKLQSSLWRRYMRANIPLTTYPGLFDVYPNLTLVDAVAAQC